MIPNNNGHDSFNGNGNGHSHYPGADLQERQVSFRDYLRVLYKGRWIIIISFLLVVISTVYYTFTTEPVYEATAKLMIEEQGGMGESLFDITSMMKKETMINNQVEILKSRSLAENVIKDLQTSKFADELRILGNLPEDEKDNASFLVGIKKWAKDLISKEGEVSDTVDYFDELVEGLRQSISVSPIRNTDMIDIKVTALSAFEAAFVTNAVAQAYVEMNQVQSQEEVRQVKNFLEDQLNQYQRELSQSEEALKNYQENAKVIALDQETEELVRKLAEFESLYNEAQTEFEANEKRLAYIDGQLRQKKVNIDMESISSEPFLNELKKQIAEKEAKLAVYIASMSDKNVDYQSRDLQDQVKLQERQIEALKAKFKTEVIKIAATEFVDPALLSSTLVTSKIAVETELESLKPKVSALKEIVTNYNNELESLPEKSLQLARLMRKTQVGEKIYIMLQEKYQESRITEVGQLGIVRVVDSAKPSKYPVKPKKKLNLILGILVGLGLGVGIAFVMEYMDNSIRTIEDIEHFGQNIIATIPFIKPEGMDGALSKIRPLADPEAQDINERLVTHLKPKSPISEAYRTLRTNIMFSKAGQEIKTLLVTSSGPKEGKSTSISNLAITFSQMGTKTLLIDADLRRPILHKLFNLDKRVGLTNVLVGRSKLEDAVQKVPGLASLDFLSCGILPPNPAELLGSRQMKEFLEKAKNEYGAVLIDTPPTIAVTDSSVLSPLVDGVLLVVRSGGTQREAFLRAVEQLKKVGAPILGIILNGILASNVYGSYYYYYYYHYYYGQDGDKKKNKKRSQRSRGVKRVQ